MDHPSESRRFGTFLIVGGLSALLNLGVFMVLWQWFHLSDNTAVILAYAVSLLFHFTMNRVWTFQNTQGIRGPQIVRYVVMVMVNFCITVAAVNLSTRMLGLTPLVGLCAAIGATTVAGYVMSRCWVFRAP